MDKRLLRQVVKVLAGPKRQQAVKIARPPVPPNWQHIFQSFTPQYAYNNGDSRAYFVKMVFWTQAGQWCGQWVAMYQTDMTGGGQFWTERYFWGFRNGSFIEIKQHDVRGPRKRMLRG